MSCRGLPAGVRSDRSWTLTSGPSDLMVALGDRIMIGSSFFADEELPPLDDDEGDAFLLEPEETPSTIFL